MNLQRKQQQQLRLLLVAQLGTFLALLIYSASVQTQSVSTSPERADYLSTFKSRALVRVWPGFGSQLDNTKGCIEIEETYDRSRKLGKLVVNAGGERSELYVRAKDKLFLEAHFLSNGSLERCSASQARPDVGYFGLFAKVAELAEKQPLGELGYFIGPSTLLYLFRDQLTALWSAKQARGVELPKTSNETERQPAETIIEYNRQESKRRRRLFIQQDPIELSLSGDPKFKVSFKLVDFSLDRSPLLAQLAPYLSFTDSRDQTYQVDYLSIEENLNLTEIRAKDPFHLPVGGFACAVSKSINENMNWKRDDRPKTEQKSTNLLTGLTYQLTTEESWTTSWPNWANRIELISDQMWAKIYSLSLYPEGVELALESEKHEFRFDIIGHSKNILDLRRKLIFHLPDEPLLESKNSFYPNDNTEEMSSADSEKIDHALNSECSILTTNELFGEVKSLERESLAAFNSIKRWHFFVGNTNSMMYLGRSRHKSSGHLAHEFELSYSKAEELPAFFMVLLASDWREIKLEGSSLFLSAKLYILADSCQVDLHEVTSSCCNPVFLAFRVELIDMKTMKLQRTEEIRLNEFHWSLAEAVGRQDGLIIGTSREGIFDLSRCPLSKLNLEVEVRWIEAISMGREGDDSPEEATTKTGGFRKGSGQCRRSGLKSLDEFVADQWALWMVSYLGPDYLLVSFDRRSIPGTKVAKYSIELAESPEQVLSFSQDLSGSQKVVTTVDQIGVRTVSLAGAKLVAQTYDTRTLFECLTWASRSSVGQIVLRSPVTGECLLFGKREENDKPETAPISLNDKEMYSNNSNKESLEEQSIKSTTTATTKYIVYARKVDQPKKSLQDSHKKVPINKSLSSLNQAILHSSKKSNNFQACIEPTRFARDIRFGPAKLASTGASHFGRSSFRGSLLHKRGYRFAVAESGSDLQEGRDTVIDSAIKGFLRTQRRALEEIRSFAQCSIGCDEEPSCVAFAFCDYPESGHQYCQPSNLKLNNTYFLTTSLQDKQQAGDKSTGDSLLVRAANCDIHAKDYSMYFQQTDSKQLAHELRDSLEWRLLAKGVTQLDCASSCYQSQASGSAPPDGDISSLSASSSPSEACLRFVHCKELDLCFHHLSYTQKPSESEQMATKDAMNSFETNPKLVNTCRHFKRKASSLYEKTLSHVDHEWIGESLFQAKMTHSSKRTCADLCTLESECQSFDECRVVMTSRSRQQRKTSLPESDSSSSQPAEYIECVQLGGSVYDNLEGNERSEKTVNTMRLVNSTITSRVYETKRYCDHFERLAAKRRLSAEQVQELFRKANLNANSIAPTDNDDDNIDDGEISDENSSYATTLFCAALLGLTLGLVAQSLKPVWRKRNKRLQGNGVNGSDIN